MGKALDPSRLRQRLDQLEALSPESSRSGYGSEIAYELSEISDSANRLREYLGSLGEITENGPSSEDLEELTRFLAYLQVEIYEELLSHCKGLEKPLQSFLARMEPLLEAGES